MSVPNEMPIQIQLLFRSMYATKYKCTHLEFAAPLSEIQNMPMI